MAVIATHPPATAARPAPSRRHARWWLAGLLVGCLLPAGLPQAELLRHAERLAPICILAPALIRASSRLQARRRARRRWPRRTAPTRPARLRRCRAWVRRATAAHDVLTRRGPPSVWPDRT
ncbi:MAG: hypothetical protein ACLFRS_00360 [Halomonas sp.]